MFEIFAVARPRYSDTLSTILSANLSPSAAAIKISLLVTCSPLSTAALIAESPSYSSAIWRAKRTTPVAEATVSKQPLFPHVHSKPVSGSTIIWPISPPAPATPWIKLPSAMTPPPTPVPSVTKTTSGLLAPAPTQRSPKAATFASLSIANGIPNSFSMTDPTSWVSAQFRLKAPVTVLFLRSTAPGDPIPIPIKSSAVSPYIAKRCFKDSIIFGTMWRPSSSVFVSIAHFSWTLPSAVKIPNLTVVPPRSIPKSFLLIFFLHFNAMLMS